MSREQALALTVDLVAGELRSVKKLKKPSKNPDARVKLSAGERPFAHPAYWAAFVLIGEAESSNGQRDSVPATLLCGSSLPG